MPSRRLDIAVVGQDPRFGGGYRSQAETFWHAARGLGRDPHLVYLSRARRTSILRPGLAFRARREVQGVFDGLGYPSLLPELDSVNQLVGAHRMAATLRDATDVWVVAASAPYGYAAVRAGRPYSCWIGTSLRDEWAARAPFLPLSRRAALHVNAPVLLRLEREVLTRAEAVYATTPYSQQAVAEAAGLPVDEVGILPIPVEWQESDPEPDDTWASRLDEPIIAFVGRANDPRKNVPMLLEAFRLLRERRPAARLRLIGQPPDRELAAQLGPGVEVIGTVDTIRPFLRSSTIFVLPSLQEGFGIVAAEALANGVPAVVTPSGGPEKLVRESGAGRVLETFEPQELADTLDDLFSDPDALLRMRQAGRAYVIAEHSPERLERLLASAFERLSSA